MGLGIGTSEKQVEPPMPGPAATFIQDLPCPSIPLLMSLGARLQGLARGSSQALVQQQDKLCQPLLFQCPTFPHFQP